MEGYQTKYAIGCLVKPGMVSFNDEEETNVMGYFVTRVYLVEESTRYYETFSSKLYRIVFPYSDIRSGKEVKPEYDIYGKPLNAKVVYDIYNTRFEATLNREQLNKSLVESKVFKVYKNHFFDKNNRVLMDEAKIQAENDVVACEEYERQLEVVDFNDYSLKRK